LTEFFLPYSARREILRHAMECWPEECVGLLSGNQEPARTWRLTNVAHHAATFLVDAAEQQQVYADIEDAGHDRLAVYHSHVRSGPRPSDSDIAHAEPGILYVIVSMAVGYRGEFGAFCVEVVDGHLRAAAVKLTASPRLEECEERRSA
jgi:proteasome lid subunit RPN8/RPN11